MDKKPIGLDIFSPPVSRVVIRGHEIDVSPVRLRNVSAFLEAFAPIAGGMGGAIMNPNAVTEDLILQIRHFVAVGIGWTDEDVESLGPIAAMQLVGAVAEVNSDLLLDGMNSQSGPRKTEGDPWVDGIQALIAAGHPLEKIGDYTVAQYKAFLEAIARSQKAEFMKLVSACRMAQYDDKSFKAAIKGLQNGE